MRRILLTISVALVAAPLAAVGAIWIWLQFDQPTPVDESMSGEPTIDLAAYDTSEPAREGARSMLILGVPHLDQLEDRYPSDTIDEVVDSLTAFDPDLVAVEYLPPEWPRGEGRDYRPDLDTATHAARFGEHEIARIASPVAWRAGVEELISIDYRGDDIRWFISQEVATFEALTSPRDLWQMLPEVNRRTREFSAHAEAHDDRLVDLLHHYNSPELIALQYWSYEQEMPQIEVRDVGQRQRDSYWRRNERMFDRLHTAVQDRDAQRILVVVGAGHRYFLDELARDHGYRWIDPREWLPEPR